MVFIVNTMIMARGTFPQQSCGDIKLFIRASPVYFNIRRRLKSNLRTRRRGVDDEWIDDAAASSSSSSTSYTTAL